MKNFENTARKGAFDLNGYKKKHEKLPVLNLAKLRSVTPEFTTLDSVKDFSDRLKKNAESSISKSADRLVLPVEIESIKELTKPLHLELYSLENKSSKTRTTLIGLEKWINEALYANPHESEAVFTLFVQELAKEVSSQSINSARLVILLFLQLKKHWENKVEELIKDLRIKERVLNQQMLESLEKAQEDARFFQSGMNEYVQKYRKVDDTNTLVKRENEILKQILVRFQHEYKLQPINFTKICELIIEDLTDLSKRTQSRIVNTIVPKYWKSIKVQTDESRIVQLVNKEVQSGVFVCSKEVQACEEVSENFTQTKKRRRNMGIFLEASIKVLAKSKTFTMINRISKQKTKVFQKKKENNTQRQVTIRSFDSKGFLIVPAEDENMPKSYENTEIETVFLRKTRKNSFSCSSLSDDLSSREQLLESRERYLSRALTPFPHRPLLSVHKKILKKNSKKAREVLNNCLKSNPKTLALEATMSVRTLLKTVESMFYSCLPKVSTSHFKGFLDHVYERLANKYSLKKMKERRLQDLIASSVRFKELLIPKLFLRSIGAGSLLGLSNYSIHTLKIVIQVLSFFNSHIFGSPLLQLNGRKMCQKSKALEFAKEIFVKRLENNEYFRVVQQIEHHSELDQQESKGYLVDIEWVVHYLVYTFDYYEKQVLDGVREIMAAVTLNNSVYIKKEEILLALRSLYGNYDKVLVDSVRSFPFLNEKVEKNSLISYGVLEKFCVQKGIFKVGLVNALRNSLDRTVEELEIDELAFKLDEISAEVMGDKRGKEELQRKLYLIRESKDPELSFVIYDKEVKRLIKISQF